MYKWINAYKLLIYTRYTNFTNIPIISSVGKLHWWVGYVLHTMLATRWCDILTEDDGCANCSMFSAQHRYDVVGTLIIWSELQMSLRHWVSLSQEYSTGSWNTAHVWYTSWSQGTLLTHSHTHSHLSEVYLNYSPSQYVFGRWGETGEPRRNSHGHEYIYE